MQLFTKISLYLLNNIECKMIKNKPLNRIKVVLAEKNVSNKTLAEQIGVGQATMSKWVTNTSQPNLEMLVKISTTLGVTIDELVRVPVESNE